MLNFWFIGEGPFAALCLKRLHALLRPVDGFGLTKVYTSPPGRGGRGMKEIPSPVQECAAEIGLPIRHTGALSQNEEMLSLLRDDPPDAIFVVDFGQVVREPFLSAPRWGCLNIHPSLLPRWRGAAPIQRALMNGDPEAGVTVFRLVPEMDAGPILRQAALPIGPDATASTLYGELSSLGADLAFDGLRALAEGTSSFKEQDASRATHAPKLSREEFEVSWAWPAERVHNAVRGLDASGGAFVPFRGERLKLWRTLPVDGTGEPGRTLRLERDGPVIACGTGAVRLEEVQAPGKRRTGGGDWARGARLNVGDGVGNAWAEGRGTGT